MSSLIKVRLEYDDGTFTELLGEDAQKWNEMQESVCLFANTHDANPFDKQALNWVKGKYKQWSFEMPMIRLRKPWRLRR